MDWAARIPKHNCLRRSWVWRSYAEVLSIWAARVLGSSQPGTHAETALDMAGCGPVLNLGRKHAETLLSRDCWGAPDADHVAQRGSLGRRARSGGAAPVDVVGFLSETGQRRRDVARP